MFSPGGNPSNDAWGQSGRGFSGGTHTGPTAAQFSFSQLWNPTANTVQLFIEHLFACVLTNDDHFQGFVSTAAQGAVITTLTNSTLGGASPSAEMRGGTLAAQPVTGKFGEYSLLKNVMQHVEFHNSIVIPPGFGFAIVALTANDEMLCNWEWREIPIVR